LEPTCQDFEGRAQFGTENNPSPTIKGSVQNSTLLKNVQIVNNTATMAEDELEVIRRKVWLKIPLMAIQARLHSHSRAFEGLMSLIPASLYYEKDSTVSCILCLLAQMPGSQQGG